MLRQWNKECISETAFRNLNRGFYLFEAYFAAVSLAWSKYIIAFCSWFASVCHIASPMHLVVNLEMESLRSSDHVLTLLCTDGPRNYCLVSLTL
jgi:hypothetical protein